MKGVEWIDEGAQEHRHPNLFEGARDIADRVRSLDRT
jgi:hypothetical protein